MLAKWEIRASGGGGRVWGVAGEGVTWLHPIDPLCHGLSLSSGSRGPWMAYKTIRRNLTSQYLQLLQSDLQLRASRGVSAGFSGKFHIGTRRETTTCEIISSSQSNLVAPGAKSRLHSLFFTLWAATFDLDYRSDNCGNCKHAVTASATLACTLKQANQPLLPPPHPLCLRLGPVFVFVRSSSSYSKLLHAAHRRNLSIFPW